MRRGYRSAQVGSLHERDATRRRCRTPAVLLPAGRLRVPRRPRRLAGPGRGRRGDRAALRVASANIGAQYETSKRVERVLATARADGGRFLNCSPDDVIFGANMTVLDFALSRTASRDWKEGDRILSRGSITTAASRPGSSLPPIAASRSTGSTSPRISGSTSTISSASSTSGCASSPASPLERRRHDRRPAAGRGARARGGGALVGRRGQYAAHEPVDVQALGCDVFICSAYKFCGPHLGVAYGRHELLESWRPYKARPATRSRSAQVRARHRAVRAARRLLGDDRLPRVDRRHGGVAAYSASSGSAPRRAAGLRDGLRPADDGGPRRTFLLNIDGVRPPTRPALAARGYGVWAHDNWYSLGLRENLPYPQERSALA